MAIHTIQNTFDVYTIVSTDGHTRASFVPEKGGVGSSLIMPWTKKHHHDSAHTKDDHAGERAASNIVERELLFQHPHFWERGNPSLPGGWPFIFPICARIARNGVFGSYYYDGTTYNLPIHGFASAMPWRVKAGNGNVSSQSQSPPQQQQQQHHHDDRITLVLEETYDTLRCYPFRFRIELEYRVENNKFICYQTYTNTGDKPLPYYGGFHPYFLTPPPEVAHEECEHGAKQQKISMAQRLLMLGKKDEVILNYKPTRRFRYNEDLTDLVGTQELFKLPTSITNPIINEQLVELGGEDKTITLAYPDGYILSLRADGVEDANMFRYVQLYTQPTEPFICIEPWMGFPNALNSVYGVRWLQPGQSEHGVLQLWG